MGKKRILVPRAVFPATVAKLREHFEVDYREQPHALSGTELATALSGKAGVLTTTEDKIDAQLAAQCDALEICANMAVGYNNLDVASLSTLGIVVTNTPDVLTESTADYAMALVLAGARRVCEADLFLRSGQWTNWRYDLMMGADVHGATLGIIGMGRIGQALARRAARGFDMNVIYHNRRRASTDIENKVGATYVEKETLLRTSDFVVLTLPYSAESHHFIAATELSTMKRSSILVNVGRGGLIDETALASALHSKTVAGAALDVFEGEPCVNPDLLRAPNALLTPHIASATLRTRERMAELAADNLISFLLHGAALTPVSSIK